MRSLTHKAIRCVRERTLQSYCVEDPLIFELCSLVCNRHAERIEEQARQFRDLSLVNRE